MFSLLRTAAAQDRRAPLADVIPEAERNGASLPHRGDVEAEKEKKRGPRDAIAPLLCPCEEEITALYATNQSQRVPVLEAEGWSFFTPSPAPSTRHRVGASSPRVTEEADTAAGTVLLSWIAKLSMEPTEPHSSRTAVSHALECGLLWSRLRNLIADRSDDEALVSEPHIALTPTQWCELWKRTTAQEAEVQDQRDAERMHPSGELLGVNSRREGEPDALSTVQGAVAPYLAALLRGEPSIFLATRREMNTPATTTTPSTITPPSLHMDHHESAAHVNPPPRGLPTNPLRKRGRTDDGAVKGRRPPRESSALTAEVMQLDEEEEEAEERLYRRVPVKRRGEEETGCSSGPPSALASIGSRGPEVATAALPSPKRESPKPQLSSARLPSGTTKNSFQIKFSGYRAPSPPPSGNSPRQRTSRQAPTGDGERPPSVLQLLQQLQPPPELQPIGVEAGAPPQSISSSPATASTASQIPQHPTRPFSDPFIVQPQQPWEQSMTSGRWTNPSAGSSVVASPPPPAGEAVAPSVTLLNQQQQQQQPESAPPAPTSSTGNAITSFLSALTANPPSRGSGSHSSRERGGAQAPSGSRRPPSSGSHATLSSASRGALGSSSSSSSSPSSGLGFVTAGEQLADDIEAGRTHPIHAPNFHATPLRSPALGLRRSGFQAPFQHSSGTGQPEPPNSSLLQQQQHHAKNNHHQNNNSSNSSSNNRGKTNGNNNNNNTEEEGRYDAADYPKCILLPDGSVPLPLQSLDPKLVAQVTHEIVEYRALPADTDHPLNEGPSEGGDENPRGAVSWDDIAGLADAKRSVEEAIVWPLRRPDLFVGLRDPPRGLLLFGPPGTGKTLIARAIASRAQCTFFNISAASLMSKWYGEAEQLVRCLFTVATVKQPSVIFVDEVDSLLSMRGDGENDAERRLKTEFLVQMDGVGTKSTDRVLLIGATNRPDELDEAARRRLEKRLYIPLPNAAARRELIQRLLYSLQQDYNKRRVASTTTTADDAPPTVHALSENDFSRLVEATEGYSGADLRLLCREAAMAPLREASKRFALHHLSLSDLRPLHRNDFKGALRRMKPSVGSSEIVRYEKWNRQFGSFGEEAAETHAKKKKKMMKRPHPSRNKSVVESLPRTSATMSSSDEEDASSDAEPEDDDSDKEWVI